MLRQTTAHPDGAHHSTTRANPRVVVLGVGYWGKNHLRNFHALGALAGFYDADAATVSRLAGEYAGVTAHRDLGQAMASDVDAVVISTPAATHGALVRQALEAGKHVFVEKPLCLDVAEAQALRDLARSRSRLLMVGHLLLYHPAFRALKQMVDSGALGTLRYIYSNRLSLGKIRREENALWSFAPHDISMILALTGAMPQSVSAAGGRYVDQAVADTTLTHLMFEGGAQAHIFVSWLHPFKDHRLVVIASEAMIVFDDTRTGAEKVRLYRHDVRWKDDVPVVARAEAEPVPYGSEEPLNLECKAFLDCLVSGAAPPSDADEGIRVLRVLDACQRALVRGTRIELSASV